MKFKKNLVAVLSVIAVFALVSCGNTNKNYRALTSHQWTLDRIVTPDGAVVTDFPEGIIITFSDSSRVFGKAGCNTFSGMYETTAYDVIGISRVASTMMWCADMDFETAYLEMLEKVSSYEATEETLQLEGTAEDFKLIYRSSKR